MHMQDSISAYLVGEVKYRQRKPRQGAQDKPRDALKGEGRIGLVLPRPWDGPEGIGAPGVAQLVDCLTSLTRLRDCKATGCMWI